MAAQRSLTMQLETKAAKSRRQIWKVVVFLLLNLAKLLAENKSTNLSHLLEPKLCFQAVHSLEGNTDSLAFPSCFAIRLRNFHRKLFHRTLRFLELCPLIFPRHGQAKPISRILPANAKCWHHLTQATQPPVPVTSCLFPPGTGGSSYGREGQSVTSS